MRTAMGGHDRHHPLFRQCGQIGDLRRMQRGASPDQRAFGRRQHGRQAVDVGGQRSGLRGRTRFGDGGVCFDIEHILGDDDGDRAGRAAFGDVEGAGDGLAGLRRFVDLDHRFRDIRQQFGIVLLLQRHSSRFEAFHLANDHDQRRGVMQRGVQSDQRVGQAGSARDDHNARPSAAHPPIGGGHERGAALMTANDQAHAVGVHQGVGEAEIALAGHAIDQVDVVRFETIDHQTAHGARHVGFPPVGVALGMFLPAGRRRGQTAARKIRAFPLPGPRPGS